MAWTWRPHHRPAQPRSLRISIGLLADLLADELPLGEKALSGYLGSNKESWRRYDACALLEDGARLGELLVDQGAADQFLETSSSLSFWKVPAPKSVCH